MKDPHYVRLSATSLRAFQECLYRFARDQVDRLPASEREPVFHLFFGSVIHKCIAMFFQRGGWPKVTMQELNQLLLDNWRDSPYKDRARDHLELQRARDMLKTFYFKRYPRRIKQELGIERFARWSTPRRGIQVVGKLDRVCLLEDGGLEVIDYKSGKAPLDPGALRKDLQALFYRTLAADLYRGLKPTYFRITFLYLANGTPMSIEYSHAEFLERWESVLEQVDPIREAMNAYRKGLPLREAFPLRRSIRCQQCPLCRHCDSIPVGQKEEETDGELPHVV